MAQEPTRRSRHARRASEEDIITSERDTTTGQLHREKILETSQCFRLIHSDPAAGLEKALELVAWGEEHDDPGVLASALLHANDACEYFDRAGDALEYRRRAEQLLTRIPDAADRAAVLQSLGMYFVRKDDLSSAFARLYECEEIVRTLNDSRRTAAVYHTLATAFEKAGAYDEALEFSLQALELFRALGDGVKTAHAMLNTGTMFGKLLDYPKALEYYLNTIEHSRAVGYHEGILFAGTNVGICLYEMKRPAEALHYLLELLPAQREHGNRTWIAETLGAIGCAQIELGNYHESLQSFQEGIEVAMKAGNRLLYAYLLGKMGEVMQIEGRLEEALGVFVEALDICLQFEPPAEELNARENLAKLYEQMGDYRNGYEQQKRILELHQKLTGELRQRSAAAIEHRHAIRAARQQQEILALRAERAELELNRRTQELNTSALQIMQRNEAFKAMQKLVEPYIRNGRGQAKELAVRVRENITTAVDSHEEWRLFEQQFENVHHDFIRVLRERCSQLTPAELKICVLIRLDLSTKQIADALFTSALTVKTHRTNIRRKLQLGAEENLSSFLLSI
ncbi:MAG TPA: tetratricopeptide repeat protein [Candidatus Kapabacteria bacterium]|nr:tetratricopeptide repeat protein [Candidatus Kapabacteria bacterium]